MKAAAAKETRRQEYFTQFNLRGKDKRLRGPATLAVAGQDEKRMLYSFGKRRFDAHRGEPFPQSGKGGSIRVFIYFASCVFIVHKYELR